MKLLNQSTSTQIITTNDYEIPGVNPDHVILRETVTEIGDDTTVHKELHKTLSDKEYGHFWPNLVLPSFFDYIKKNNPFSPTKDTYVHFLKETDFPNNGELIWTSTDDHTLYDSNLEPLPYAKSYDYIGTFFSNKYINFNDDFLNFLREHPWVVNKDTLKIKNIPHYNAENGRDLFVGITVYPDKKTYKEIHEYSKEKSNSKRYVCFSDLIVGSPCYPFADFPDWFGIKPWLKDPNFFKAT